MIKKALLVAVLLAAVAVVGARLAVAGEGCAGAGESLAAAPAETAVAAAVPVVSVNNTVCPVEGTLISKPGEYTVEYESVIYNLCCENCKAEFLKDPAKYIAKVNEEMAKADAAAAQVAATMETEAKM
jgi:YHS domain-containing protein